MSDLSIPDPGRWSWARNVARALFTGPSFLVQHLWRRRRVDDVTQTVVVLDEQPPRHLSAGAPSAESDQTAVDGVGPLVMRTYEVPIAGATLSPGDLMARLTARPGDFNDDRIAGFVVDDRPAVALKPGDRLVVELPGPWNGPVRVVAADESQLLLQTLDGHMEAGSIRFDVVDAIGGTTSDLHDYTFRIRSWARGGDAAFNVLHLGLRIAKEMQTAMWVAMCEGAVQISEGERVGLLRVTTEVLAESSPEHDPLGDVLEQVGGG